MLTAIDSQAVWRGNELFQREDWEYTFSAEDLAELDKALRHVLATGQDIEQTSREDFPLPRLASRLSKLQDDLEHRSGAATLRGFPVDRYDEHEATRIFWGLTSHLGTAVPQTAQGARLFHVRDEGYAANDPKARGPSSRKRLSFHSDRGDVIAFLGLQQAKSGGDNLVVSAVSVFNEMLATRPDFVEVLMQPYYYQRHNVDTGNERPYYEQPIFSIYEGCFAAQLLRVLIERAYQMPEIPAMAVEQREALDYLEELAERPDLHVRFRQQPGEILLLNNLVTLHRRDEFVDWDEPERKRHLLRIWLSMPNSRPIDPAFVDHFGAVEAGALRGGIHPERGRRS